MAFIDEVKIHAKAGHGGAGVVRWRREKSKDKMGPSGGNGGRGGNVFIEGIRDIGALAQYRNIKGVYAEDGGAGMKSSMHGKEGKDAIIKLPVGSFVKNIQSGETFDVVKESEKIKILKGGAGGLGNEYFKASTNVRPMQSTPGYDGEEADFEIELRLIVDAGFVGFPNAGKSSLLNVLTNARAKVASYQFTTLEPNLGALYGFILADIPGLIHGASKGKGLGHKFLRHIRRTKMILHCISLENENIKEAYKTIRAELSAYDKELAEKKEIIILTKTDLVNEKTLAKKIKEAKKLNFDVFYVSIVDDKRIKNLKDELVKILRAS